jgi:hypothetical protein
MVFKYLSSGNDGKKATVHGVVFKICFASGSPEPKNASRPTIASIRQQLLIETSPRS